jgi:hypothetical protein
MVAVHASAANKAAITSFFKLAFMIRPSFLIFIRRFDLRSKIYDLLNCARLFVPDHTVLPEWNGIKSQL